MARTKKIDGFSFEDIVNTNINNDINDNVNVNDNGNVNNDVDDNLKDKENFLENLKPEKEKKIKTLLYIDSDIANHLDFYGEKLGK
ncbi:TPA: hypothetical protein IUU37_002527, partial [Enterococcus faecalis]|nr:hypothetical protein [Enterococcus faecalis]